MGWQTDYWTGFYTSRPHLKGLIFSVFNHILATKTFLYSALLRKSLNSLKLGADGERVLHEANSLVFDAEREWAILMHHDGITGT